MSSKIGAGNVRRWLGVMVLLLWLTGCQGEAASQTPPPTAATTTVNSTAGAAAFDSSPAPTLSSGGRGAMTAPSQTPTAESLPSATAVPTLFALPSATPLPTEPLSSPQPSATPDCVDSLLYLEDVTIPDGTVVTPGASIDKRWRVQNNGSCNWDSRYRVRRISGPELGLPDDQALFPARSGTEAMIRLLLTAPIEPGAYRSAWQAISPLGEPFGDPIYVEIIVATSNP